MESLKEELAAITRDVRDSFAKADKLVMHDLLEEWGLRDNDIKALARVAEEIRYRRTVQQLPSRARSEALAGKRFAIVYSFSSGEVRRVDVLPPVGEDGGRFCTSDMLIGVAERVYKYCASQHLWPTIEYWQDRLSRGWNILIHW